MAYNVMCGMCRRVKSVSELTRAGNLVRCSSCTHRASLAEWREIGGVPNPLPARTYVTWGQRTKENRDTGLLRTAMEGAAMMRPGKAAKPGSFYKGQGHEDGDEYAPLQAGGSAVMIYIAKDDVLLKGNYYGGGPANGCAAGLTMLLLNGSGASIGKHMNEVITRYRGWGANVLAVDYRGTGQSTGRATSHGLYTDAEAMLAYLTDVPAMNGRGIAAETIVVHGYSFGSGPACELTIHHAQPEDGPLAGLVLHCPFKSFGSAAAFKVPLGKAIVGKVASWGVGYNNIRKLLHMGSLPVHIIYADQDRNVNPQDARDLAAVQRTGVTTIQEYSGGHEDCGQIFFGFTGGNTTGTLKEFVTGAGKAGPVPG